MQLAPKALPIPRAIPLSFFIGAIVSAILAFTIPKTLQFWWGYAVTPETVRQWWFDKATILYTVHPREYTLVFFALPYLILGVVAWKVKINPRIFKTLFIVITLALSSFILFVPMTVTYAVSTNQSFTPNNYTGVASYSQLIFTDGTYYYAKEGSGGSIDYGGPGNAGGATGTNATQVIRSASCVNCFLYVNDGTYLLSGRTLDRAIGTGIYYQIALYSGEIIQGQSETGVVFESAASYNASIFVADQLGVGQANNVQLKDFTINGHRGAEINTGQDGNQACIYANQNNQWIIQNLFIENCVRQGVYDSFTFNMFAQNIYITNTGDEGYGASRSSNSVYQNIIATNTGQLVGTDGNYQSGIYVSGTYEDYFYGLTSYSNLGYGLGIVADGSTTDTNRNYFYGVSTFSNSANGTVVGTTQSNTFTKNNQFYGVDSVGNGGDGFDLVQARGNGVWGLTSANNTGAELHFYSAQNNTVQQIALSDTQAVHTGTWAVIEDGASDSNNNVLFGNVGATAQFTVGKFIMQSGSGSTLKAINGFAPSVSAITNTTDPTYTWTNNLPYPVYVVAVSGTALTGLTVNGVAVATTQGIEYYVAPLQTVIFNWAKSSAFPAVDYVPIT